MSNDFNDYVSSSADWRKTLRQNQTRTYIVIFIFILIYTSVGMIVDLFLVTSQYPDAPIPAVLEALATFKIFPIATVVMLVIAGLSLLVTYSMYDTIMLLGTEYHEITPETAQTMQEKQLYNVIEEMKIAAGLRYMPRVYIIEANYMNAFASGYSEKSAMVAITRGLIDKLTRDELQAVMAHELSHIRHLDIKLTLTASLLANMTIIVLDILYFSALSSNNRGSNKSRGALTAIVLLLRYTLPIINILLLLYLSRRRELMADAGSVELMRSNKPIASALMKIHDDHAQHQAQYSDEYANTPHEHLRRESYLFDPTQAGISGLASMSELFSSHPSLAARLEALGLKKRK